MKHIKGYTELFEGQVGPKIRKSNLYEGRIFSILAPLGRTGKLEKIEMWKSEEKWREQDVYYPVAFVRGFKPIRFYFLKYFYKDTYNDGKIAYYPLDYRMDYQDSIDIWNERDSMIPQFYKDLEEETGLIVDPNGVNQKPEIAIQKVADAIEKTEGGELEKGFDWKKTQIGDLLLAMGFQEVPGSKNTEHTGNIYLDHPLSPYSYAVTMAGYIRRKRKSDRINIQGFAVRTNPIITQKQYEELLKGLLKTLRLDIPKDEMGLLDGYIRLAEDGLISAIENNIPLPYSEIIKDSPRIRAQWEAGGFEKEKAVKLERRWNILQRDL